MSVKCLIERPFLLYSLLLIFTIFLYIIWIKTLLEHIRIFHEFIKMSDKYLHGKTAKNHIYFFIIYSLKPPNPNVREFSN